MTASLTNALVLAADLADRAERPMHGFPREVARSPADRLGPPHRHSNGETHGGAGHAAAAGPSALGEAALYLLSDSLGGVRALVHGATSAALRKATH